MVCKNVCLFLSLWKIQLFLELLCFKNIYKADDKWQVVKCILTKIRFSFCNLDSKSKRIFVFELDNTFKVTADIMTSYVHTLNKFPIGIKNQKQK